MAAERSLPIDSPLQNVVVAIRSSVSSSRRSIGGRSAIVLHNEETGKFYHLGMEEAVVVSMLDGSLNAGQIITKLQSLGIVWGMDDMAAFLTMLVKSGLAAVVGQNGQASPTTNVREPAAKRSVFQIVRVGLSGLLSQRIPLGNADSLASRLLPWLRHAFTGHGLVVWLALVLAAVAVAFEHRAEMLSQCRQMFAPEYWPLLAGVGLVVKVVHEIGHAVAAKRQGVRVGPAGVTLFMLAPLAYVDVTDAWKLTSRWSRIQIAMAGVYLESWLAILATFLFVCCDEGLVRHISVQLMLVAGPASWLINANPLLRLDGYYALSDAVDIPNLRMHGRKRWADLLNHWALGQPCPDSLLVGWRRPFATVHAAASCVFQFLWMTGIVVAISSWAGIVGKVLAVAAFIAWFVTPIVGWWIQHWTAAPRKSEAARTTHRRMVAFAATVAMLVSSALSSRNPFAHGVPVVVQHHDEQVGRAATDGFVTAVLVRGNQIVARGDLLVEITDENLVLKREQMNDELHLNLTKYRQLQNSGKLAEAEAANETAKQLRTSIAELDQSLSASRIIAERDGIVVSEHPEKWLGRFAKRGDVLVRVAEPHDKELLVAIKERDLSAYNHAVSQAGPFVARIRGGTRLTVEPAAARPRFVTELPHPALATTNGGSIPVTPDPESPEGVKPAMPIGQAQAIIPPTQSLGVRAGQRGVLYLDDDQTIYARLVQWVVDMP
ncbi:MAG: site-2 protease family protein [Planctomycetaceae bacterium]